MAPFVPKSPQERAAFNSTADEKERVADAEENESRSSVLPTLVHPFESPVTHQDIEIERAAIPMRDGVKLAAEARDATGKATPWLTKCETN